MAHCAAELDTQQLMDVVFTVGAYEVFAMALRTFDVELDDDLPALQLIRATGLRCCARR